MTRKFHARSPPRDPLFSQSVHSSPSPSPSSSRRQFPHSSSSPRLHRSSAGVSPIPSAHNNNQVTHHHILGRHRGGGGGGQEQAVVRVLQYSSVHHRNLYLASRPLVLVFDLASVALNQIFLLLRAILLLIWNPISSVWRRYRLRATQGQTQESCHLTSVRVCTGTNSKVEKTVNLTSLGSTKDNCTTSSLGSTINTFKLGPFTFLLHFYLRSVQSFQFK
jgi:hypothetical protein